MFDLDSGVKIEEAILLSAAMLQHNSTMSAVCLRL